MGRLKTEDFIGELKDKGLEALDTRVNVSSISGGGLHIVVSIGAVLARVLAPQAMVADTARAAPVVASLARVVVMGVNRLGE
jgi:hypothetical protein